jgi:flagellar assembly protein FliH
MNLSRRVIKPSLAAEGNDDILTAKVEEGHVDSFQTFESLWRDGDGNVASIAGVKERKRIMRAEADAIVAEAQSRVAEIEKTAFDKGLAEGRAAAQKEVSAKIKEVAELLREIQKERQNLYSRYEEDLVALLKSMLDKIVNHEVSVNPRVISACLKKALSYVIENSLVKIHLNSVDFAKIKEAALENPDILEGFNQLELIEDQSISAGGCLLETEFGQVDATIENRKEKLFEAIDRAFMQSLSEG